jgi:DNA-binding GntR family transcriptional regulator
MLFHIRRLEALYFRDAGPGLESYREHRDLIECVRRGATAAATEITRRNFQRFATAPK